MRAIGEERIAEYCTIFGQTADYAGVLRRVRQMSPGPVGVVGDANRWKKLVLQGKQATLTLSSMEREKPGDDFSKLVLSTHNFLRKMSSDKLNKESVLKAVSSSLIAVGVVAEPALEDEADKACVLDVARILNGVIFNGTAMLDLNGSPLLDTKD